MKVRKVDFYSLFYFLLVFCLGQSTYCCCVMYHLEGSGLVLTGVVGQKQKDMMDTVYLLCDSQHLCQEDCKPGWGRWVGPEPTGPLLMLALRGDAGHWLMTKVFIVQNTTPCASLYLPGLPCSRPAGVGRMSVLKKLYFTLYQTQRVTFAIVTSLPRSWFSQLRA